MGYTLKQYPSLMAFIGALLFSVLSCAFYDNFFTDEGAHPEDIERAVGEGEVLMTQDALTAEAADATADTENEPVPICSLLPVDAGLVTDESDFGDFASCSADIDSLVGCNSCGSMMSISRLPSTEAAQNGFSIPDDCGPAEVFSDVILPRLPITFGDLGYACPDSFTEFEDGVAIRYFSIWFTQGSYSVFIISGKPGVDGLILGLGEEIVIRINLSS